MQGKRRLSAVLLGLLFAAQGALGSDCTAAPCYTASSSNQSNHKITEITYEDQNDQTYVPDTQALDSTASGADVNVSSSVTPRLWTYYYYKNHDGNKISCALGNNIDPKYANSNVLFTLQEGGSMTITIEGTVFPASTCQKKE